MISNDLERDNMKISVVVTTYNGEKYIEKQLQSIVSQTLMPNEIVVADDKSHDDTFSILKRIESDHPEIKWNIYQNPQNLGWKVNFKNAILATTGDIIFLADQDDIWDKDKIKTIVEIFHRYQDIGILACAYERVNESDSFDPEQLSSEGNLAIEKFDKYFYMTHHPGCSMAFLSCYKKAFLFPEWNSEQPHDEYLWGIGKLQDQAYFYSGRLQYFIRHEESATNVNNHNKQDRLAEIQGKINCVATLELILKANRLPVKNRTEKIDSCEKCKNFLTLRYKYIKEPTLGKLLSLIRKMGYYEKFRFFIADIAFARKRLSNVD